MALMCLLGISFQYMSIGKNVCIKQLTVVCLVIPSDANVGLDQILIQLKEVAPQWRSLAETAGLDHDTLDRISEYVSLVSSIHYNIIAACIII